MLADKVRVDWTSSIPSTASGACTKRRWALIVSGDRHARANEVEKLPSQQHYPVRVRPEDGRRVEG